MTRHPSSLMTELGINAPRLTTPTMIPVAWCRHISANRTPLLTPELSEQIFHLSHGGSAPRLARATRRGLPSLLIQITSTQARSLPQPMLSVILPSSPTLPFFTAPISHRPSFRTPPAEALYTLTSSTEIMTSILACCGHLLIKITIHRLISLTTCGVSRTPIFQTEDKSSSTIRMRTRSKRSNSRTHNRESGLTSS